MHQVGFSLHDCLCCLFDEVLPSLCGPGSSVCIATDYELDGPGSNSGGDEIFRPSRSALEPTKPPVKWVSFFPGGKVRPGRAADHSPPSSATVMEDKSRAIPLPTLWATPGL